MRDQDPLTWSVPAGHYFGIRVRISLLFLLFLLVQFVDGARGGVEGLKYTLLWEFILVSSVLLHEFGHCFAARSVGGAADEILLWPLGGLAFVSTVNTPRAHFITTVWGPLVNVGICLVTGAVILASHYGPPINPLHPLTLTSLPGSALDPAEARPWVEWFGFAFGLNLIMVLFNLLPAFPLDGGRMFRCLLWVRLGFADATRITVQVAKVFAIILGIIGVLLVGGDRGVIGGLLLIAVAVFIYYSSEVERRMLLAGELFDESVFGYDFSQGYTSLTRSTPRARARRPTLWERWRRRRERIRQQRAQAEREMQERLVDEILAKLHRDGMGSLTERERRFLTRVSAKYRSRNRTDD